MKKRIWELDALRGLCVLGMILVHLLYNLDAAGIVPMSGPMHLLQRWGSVAFLLISGICVTLGRRHIRRGLAVFACGLLCTAVTGGMYLLGLADRGILIWFGVLHCLGSCMLLWTLFSRLPRWSLALSGLAAAAVGLLMTSMRVDFPWLIFLGLRTPDFASADYFPLLPNLGWFLLGAWLGRLLYREHRSLIPNAPVNNPLLRALCFIGRHSLIVYLLHQPLLTAVIGLAARFYP